MYKRYSLLISHPIESDIHNERGTRIEGQKDTYFGQFLTPSWVSLDSGGFFSILIPNFSVAIEEEYSAAIEVTDLLLLLVLVGAVRLRKVRLWVWEFDIKLLFTHSDAI